MIKKKKNSIIYANNVNQEELVNFVMNVQLIYEYI
jgi:hypothetical protein